MDAIRIENTTIVNVYHPPPGTSDITSLPTPTENFIAAKDLNHGHESWRYPYSSFNEKNFANWATTNNLLTLYDLKQPASCISGRWQRGTNPDLTFSTQIYETTPERYIMERFPRSQQKLFLITTPLVQYFRAIFQRKGVHV